MNDPTNVKYAAIERYNERLRVVDKARRFRSTSKRDKKSLLTSITNWFGKLPIGSNNSACNEKTIANLSHLAGLREDKVIDNK